MGNQYLHSKILMHMPDNDMSTILNTVAEVKLFFF